MAAEECGTLRASQAGAGVLIDRTPEPESVFGAALYASDPTKILNGVVADGIDRR